MKHFILLLLLLYNFCGRAQHALSGTVLDAQTNGALSNASLFLPTLHQGVSSLADGTFSIVGIPPGRFLLEISHVGYKTAFFHINAGEDTLLKASLDPSVSDIKTVVITGAKTQAPDETTFNVAQLGEKTISDYGAFNLTDALARIPGVNQLTTGAGISKPVIRGLYGNRIQVNVNGLRFDNQQWQDEHGLGLSDMGVEQVEVIRGPASVLYGSDAMGGVLNVIEERPALLNTQENELRLRFYTNTLGFSGNYGFKKSAENRWKTFYAGADSHADYTDGNNNRILNSRFSAYNAKAAWGRNNERGTHVISLMASHSMFGFVFDSLARKEKDARMSRSFDGPHHLVSFVQISSENTYFKSSKEIKLNAGFTSNLRMEDEGGGGISLSMLLNSANALLQITQPTGAAAEWTYGTSIFFQSNTNFGGRIIIPDAITGEASAFTYYKYHPGKWLLEGGARYDKKWIETFATGNLNVIGNDSPTQDIVPFTNFYDAFNFSLGAGYNLAKGLGVKINASTGYRPGNLAELSSNGLHEGTLRWEIGLPDAKIEQNLNVEASLVYNSRSANFSASAYNNSFRNFFYLAGTGTEYYGFAIYRFQQADAQLRGGEFSIDWAPERSPLSVNGSYSFIRAEKENGERLPFIPANKVMGELKWRLSSLAGLKNLEIRSGGTYVFNQNHPAEFETPTERYFLLHAGINTSWHRYNFTIVGNNLLDKNYYDHLSRFKYYGIANMGRSIVISMNFKF